MSQDGQTALIIAASVGKVDVVKILLLRGANIEAKDNVGVGLDPTFFACCFHILVKITCLFFDGRMSCGYASNLLGVGLIGEYMHCPGNG